MLSNQRSNVRFDADETFADVKQQKGATGDNVFRRDGDNPDDSPAADVPPPPYEVGQAEVHTGGTMVTTTTTMTVTTVTTRTFSKGQSPKSAMRVADMSFLTPSGESESRTSGMSHRENSQSHEPKPDVCNTSDESSSIISPTDKSLRSTSPPPSPSLSSSPTASKVNAAFHSPDSPSIGSVSSKRYHRRRGSAPSIPSIDFNNENLLASDSSDACTDRRRTLMLNQTYKETPQQYLERVQDTLSKAELATLLAQHKDVFHEAVFRTYMESFDFREDSIDLALRKFLMECHLPKETQQIDRVVEAFARRYHECNPDLLPSQDAAHMLAFSLLMLHTDAFNKSVKRKMTKEEFVRNSRIDGLPSEILEILYDNITFMHFVYVEDDTDVNGLRMLTSPSDNRQSRLFGSLKQARRAMRPRNDPYFVIQHKVPTDFTPNLKNIVPLENPYSYKGTLPELDIPYLHRAFTTAHTIRITGVRERRSGGEIFNPTSSSVHSPEGDGNDGTFLLKITKAGRLSRKIDLLEGGRKAGGFVRGWKQFGVILSGSQLMFFKDVTWFNTRMSEFGDPTRSTRLPILKPDVVLMTADSVALYDKSYRKHPYVFRLVCPKGHQYLFQAESEEEANDWIVKINYAATFKTAGVKMRHVRSSSLNSREHKRRKNQPQPFYDYHRIGDETTASETTGRADVLRSKIEDLQGKIATHTFQLHQDVRFIKNLAIMIPYKATTRDYIMQVATTVSRRLKQTFLELSRLLCYHEIMEKDLCATTMEDADYWHRRKSMLRGGHDCKERRVRESRSEEQELQRAKTIAVTHSPESSLTYSILVTPPDSPSRVDSFHRMTPSELDLIQDAAGEGSADGDMSAIRDDVSSFSEIEFDDSKESSACAADYSLNDNTATESILQSIDRVFEAVSLGDFRTESPPNEDFNEDSVEEEFVDAEEGED